MEWIGLNELREKFLSFYETKGHTRLQSFPLIPQGDKSLLLINSGMAPMKKFFTGEVTPPNTRVTTCQKCIRTPDIERVGKTARHGTYFEMLGNFSFGDYFKREATAWAWEFCTKVLEMPVDRLWVSIYENDDEAFKIWTEEVGVSPDRIVRLGKEDNFWEHGSGPCGPCSEIYYDRGEEYGCGSPTCGVGCDCDRYTEFWNLVFTQFKSDGHGNYSNLEHPNIDTGMGLERLACISQGVANLFEVDTVQRIMQHVIKLTGVPYHEDEKKDVSLRVITDHIRSATFMIGDGVMPSNEGREYVLRRLLRRAARHGRLLGMDKPFLYEVCNTVIDENEKAYPNLAEKREFIAKVILTEEENFCKTIDTGLPILEQMIKESDGKVLSGENAFKLSDTFGFPIDLTREFAEEKGMTIDEDSYQSLVTEQRRRARSARKDAGADAWKETGKLGIDVEPTVFAGYDKMTVSAQLLAAVKDGETAEYLEQGDEATLILDTTPFYGESGGQIGDVGTVSNEDFTFRVTSTSKTADGIFLHHGVVAKGSLDSVHGTVTAQVDEKVRKSVMRNHTAAHLLQAALRRVLGSHVEQAGQFVNGKEVRFDFSHFEAMTTEQLNEVEAMVNEVILSAIPVTSEEMAIEDAKKLGAMALFGEKYGDVVRVVRAGDFSLELCGGTHVTNTAQIGLFKILSETSVAAGVRRIQAVTGEGVLDYLNQNIAVLQNTARVLKVGNVSDVERRARQLSDDLKAVEKENERLRADAAANKAQSLLSNAKQAGSVSLISAVLPDDTNADTLRSMCDTAKQSGDNVVAVLASVQSEKGTISFAASCAKGAVALGAHAGNIVRAVAKIAGGSGGGKPDAAMAGGKDVTKLEEAMAAVEEIVLGFLKSER